VEKAAEQIVKEGPSEDAVQNVGDVVSEDVEKKTTEAEGLVKVEVPEEKAKSKDSPDTSTTDGTAPKEIIEEKKEPQLTTQGLNVNK